MRIDSSKCHFVLRDNEGSGELEISYDNYGDPFREGLRISIREDETAPRMAVFLDDHEVQKLRDHLNQIEKDRQ